jgi:hypothetical protein
MVKITVYVKTLIFCFISDLHTGQLVIFAAHAMQVMKWPQSQKTHSGAASIQITHSENRTKI